MTKKRNNNGIFYGIISLVAILAVGSVRERLLCKMV